MIPEIRAAYNQAFNQATYQAFLNELHSKFNHVPGFRIAETPVFIPRALSEKIFEACNEISDAIVRPGFKALTEPSLAGAINVPGEDAHTTFLQMDFGLVEGEHGEVVPRLIEVQGFPSLYFYQHYIAELYRKYFPIPDTVNHLFSGFTPETYIEFLRKIIVGEEDPAEVVLLEIDPFSQNTQIDFHATRKILGIHIADVTDLYKRGDRLFYKNEKGQEVRVKRIYNRVIFDELMSRTDLDMKFSFTDELEVKWVGHPNWFFRISKYTLPFIPSSFIPTTIFLDQLKEIPANLDQYVLKPLYSFSGSGVIFHVKPSDIENIKTPSQFILQQKVKYLPVIRTPDDDPVKVEVRIMLIWPEGEPRPIIVNNLARLSKGEMIGVKFNKDKTWVGGSVGFYE